MLVSWVAQAWEDLHKYDNHLIQQTFIDLGLSLPIDGSRDNEIKIKDLPGIQVGDWKSWAPTNGCIQLLDRLVQSWLDTVTSNQTVDEIKAQAIKIKEADIGQDSQGNDESDNSTIK
jgi:hypothetical protein